MVALSGTIKVDDSPVRWGLAPSLVNFLLDLQARYPRRSTRMDGSIGDAAHQQRNSDHNVRRFGTAWYVLAVDVDADIDNDPSTNDAPETSLIIAAAIAHPATQYVIFNGVIWNRSRQFRPVPYTGPNKHSKHLHISVSRTLAAVLNDDAWFPNTPEVDDMPYTPEQLKSIIKDALGTAVADTSIRNKWGETHRLGDVLAAMDYNIVQTTGDVDALKTTVDKLPAATADAMLDHRVKALDPATGKATEIRVEETLTRASEATILRQNDGITKRDDVGTTTEMLEALLADRDPKTGKLIARDPRNPPANS